MILIIFLLILAAGYSYSFYFTGLSLWFYFLWVPLSLILSLLTFVILMLIYLAYMIHTDPKGKFRHFVFRQICHVILIFSNVKLEVIGKEYIPNQTFVCYANHKSDIDPLALYYALHKVCSLVGKKDLFEYPFIKQGQAAIGLISIDRDNDRAAAKSIIECIRQIKNGLSYIIFPEGGIKTRSTEEMVDLRAGAYKLVTKTGALLLPATIIGSSNTYKRKSVFHRVKMTIIFHKPITEEEYGKYNTTEIGQKVIEIINKDVDCYENKLDD